LRSTRDPKEIDLHFFALVLFKLLFYGNAVLDCGRRIVVNFSTAKHQLLPNDDDDDDDAATEAAGYVNVCNFIRHHVGHPMCNTAVLSELLDCLRRRFVLDQQQHDCNEATNGAALSFDRAPRGLEQPVESWPVFLRAIQHVKHCSRPLLALTRSAHRWSDRVTLDSVLRNSLTSSLSPMLSIRTIDRLLQYALSSNSAAHLGSHEEFLDLLFDVFSDVRHKK
jgi:hypothetical protein